MAFHKALLIVLATGIGLSECAYVDTLNKCHINDNDCLKALIKNVLQDISEPGIPELNIPPIDPIQIKNLNVSILNIIHMILINGTAKGIKNCVINKFEANIEKLHAYLDLTCDIRIKSTYNLKSESPVLKNLLGGNIHGEGIGKANMEKLQMKIDFLLKVVKRDSDIYLVGKEDKLKYTVDIGKLTFAADNLYLGDKESSKEIVNILNQNWKLLFSAFGNKIFDVAISLVRGFILNFFENVPTKHYIIDDLSQYIQ